VVCGEIKATIALVIRGVAKEDTSGKPRDKLMWHCGGSVRVTRVAEDSLMLVRGCRPKKGEMRTCSVKLFSPIAPKKGCLNKQRTNDIVNTTNDMFDFTIMRRHWTRHLELCVSYPVPRKRERSLHTRA
jgi:hypothetical protein